MHRPAPLRSLSAPFCRLKRRQPPSHSSLFHRQGFHRSALPDPHFYIFRGYNFHKLGIGASRKSLVMLKMRSDLLQRKICRAVHENNGMGISHRNAGHAVCLVLHSDLFIDGLPVLETTGTSAAVRIGSPISTRIALSRRFPPSDPYISLFRR